MDMMNSGVKVWLYPRCLQFIFSDRNKSYHVMVKYIEDYKQIIRSLYEQKELKKREKDMFLEATIHRLHRQLALHVAKDMEQPCDCDEFYSRVRREVQEPRTPAKKVKQRVFRLKMLARKSVCSCLCV
ncbi:uncharacterized protein LOC101852482 [Aplysia californica]|uniref:Uncharacterized protein LOC101852482 n=1 Tax=Aplysia californica TaxID=6500 RepID=A0ABM0JSD4_APLCA|nr:uncharacterized protein LOC101852482 [Aplysia californica]